MDLGPLTATGLWVTVRIKEFYDDRTIDIHVQVHTGWKLRENRTIVIGSTISTGQIHFPEKVSATIRALEPYASHTQIARIANAEDSFFPMDLAGGFNPIIHVVTVDQENITKGMVGYITLGVDTTLISNGSQPWGNGQNLDTTSIGVNGNCHFHTLNYAIEMKSEQIHHLMIS